jgi:hypothetical protein
LDKKSIAEAVSALMNAPLLTLITFIPLVFKYGNRSFFQLLGLTSFFGCLLPLVMIVYMLKKGIISDFYARERMERFIPFLSTIASYTMGTISLILVKAPAPITALMACYLVNGIVLLLITFKWKISIHASGIASPVTALVYLLGTRLLPLFLLFIPVAWARVELKAHDKLQVTMGAIISSLLTWFQMAFYVKYVFI